MKIHLSLIIAFSLAVVFKSVFAEEQLSDYEKFVSYPYLEKAYRFQNSNDYLNAIEEIKKAIDIAPNHAPYKVLLFEYYVASNQQSLALDLYSTLPNLAKGTLLASLIELQIKDDKLTLTRKLKELLNSAPPDRREALYLTVASRFIGKGQESLVYEWMKEIEFSSPELVATKIKLADKLEEYQDVEQLFIQLDDNSKTPELSRIYALSLLKINQVEKALDYANLNPSEELSFDIYYQYLQSSIANGDIKATENAFAWIEAHHQVTPEILEQRFEFAIQTRNKQSAFAILPQLNASCQKRVELALSFDWLSKAKDDLITCQNTMEKALWITYAGSLLSESQMRALIQQQVRYSDSLSDLLIERYIANEKYQLAVNEIIRAKKQSKYTQQLAISYEELGDIESALSQYEIIYTRQENDTILDKITFLLAGQSDFGAVKSYLEKRLISKPMTMPANLVARLVRVYQQQSVPLTSVIADSLKRVQNNYDAIAELFRLNDNCVDAIYTLDNSTFNTAQSFQTRALCAGDDSPQLAYTLWQKAYEINPTNDTLRSVAFAQGRLGLVDEALNSLNTLGVDNWSPQDALYAAQLAYQQRNFEDAQRYWTKADDDSVAWLDFGTQLAIQQQDFTNAQFLSQRLIEKNNELTAQQWARQATIYQRTEQIEKASRAWQIATEKDPSNTSFKLAWAYSLIDTQRDKAFLIMKEAIDNSSEVDSRTWEQLGYLAASNKDHEGALKYITQSVVTERDGPVPRGEELSWLLHEYYRDLAQYWRFSASASQGTGGILGEVFFVGNDGQLLAEPPTNNLTTRAEYFFNPLTKKWSAYAQLSSNGTDNSPLSEWSKELGISYKLFDDLNLKGTVGAQRFFSGNWEGLIRINGDLLNQGKWRQGWRFEDSWWERQLYFDLLWLPESDQALGLARFDIGYVYSLDTQSKQTLKYYGLAQYDIRKPQNRINGQSSFDQSSFGLGIQWRLFTTPDSPFDRVHKYSVALEWRIKASGDLTNDDSSVFLIANYQY